MNEDAVFCDGLCQAWAHRKCIGLSKQLYKVISESGDIFLCSYCSLACYQKEIADLSEKIKMLSSQAAQLKSPNLSLNTDESGDKGVHTCSPMNVDLVDQSNTGQSQPTPSQNQPQVTPPQDISKIVTTVLSEEKEKEKQRLNLILHNLKESPESNPQKRKECDIEETKKLFQNHLGVRVGVTNATRIGKKNDDTNKPRLLKVTVNSTREKAEVLRNCTKLRNKDNPAEIQSVYITPDLTPKEQKENKALRNQLAELNKSEKLYKIKNGKIVRREM